MSTILLVDDDPVLLSCLAESLERMQYAVIARRTAVEALAEVAGGLSVDLLITDYRMACMDGIELLHQFRLLRPRIPAVVLTGHGTIDSFLKARSLGAAEFIRKPVKTRELIRVVELLLADRAGTVTAVRKCTQLPIVPSHGTILPEPCRAAEVPGAD